MLIGVTGKSGSGKTTYARSLEGFTYIGFDDIGHEAVEAHAAELEKAFGTSDRKMLGELVFSSREKRQELTGMLWKDMQDRIDSRLHGDCVLDFILLPRTRYWSMCDRKVLVKAPLETRKARVLARDGISEDYFDLRERASIEYDEGEMDEIIDGA